MKYRELLEQEQSMSLAHMPATLTFTILIKDVSRVFDQLNRLKSYKLLSVV